ncbi:MAG: helix-turn-helix transcriptional regulator [Acidobacteriota bacterium]|nr:helix-turn-helix transcriptional regulator [Acidobacteriota bacterium]
MKKEASRVKRPARRAASAPARRAGGGESKVCARFHHAVELIGRRWSGAILSVMLRGPQCFNEMLAAVPGLSDRLLTERLRELESEGLLRRTVLPGPPVRVSYELTEAGKSLEPVIESLGRWAERWVKA